MTELESQAEQRLLGGLFDRYHRLLVRFLTRMTHCPQRGEDLAQVAWLKLLCARSRGICLARDEAELRAYLFTVARNAFLDECTRKHEAVRTRAVDPALLDALVAESGMAPGPEEEFERQQLSSLVQCAIGGLPPEQRDVIRMWSRGTSIRDMAASSSAPVDTVLSRKKYAFARMRGQLAGVVHALG